MFDIDGTLVESFEFDEECFTAAINEVIGVEVDTDWNSYTNVTDTGLLMELIDRSGLKINASELEAKVKPVFIENVASYLEREGISPISGALEFINRLRRRKDVVVSMATGGWRETALLKLQAAGLDIEGIEIASSNDDFRRTKIMQKALIKTGVVSSKTPIYFGDAEWDRIACEELGFHFVLVGDRTHHEFQIKDFRDDSLLQRLNLY